MSIATKMRGENISSTQLIILSGSTFTFNALVGCSYVLNSERSNPIVRYGDNGTIVEVKCDRQYPKCMGLFSITATAAGVGCEHSPLLTTLHLASTAKLNIVVRPPVLNRKRDIPKICDVASGRTEGCTGLVAQDDIR